MKKSNAILVTGAHRSGTTWVGKMIAAASSVQYIHEPFNIDYSPYKVKPDYWFQYVTQENEGLLYEQIKKLVSAKNRPLTEEKKGIKQFLKFLKSNPQEQRVVIKDPIAVFSAEWMCQRFNMDVVITIRHPAAFVDSIRERKWTHDFNHFLNQPLLLEEHLAQFKEEIISFTKKEYPIIDQAILLWKLIYYMVGIYKEKYSHWFFIRHEDLSASPVEGFKEIFKYLDIKFSKKILKIIKEHSSDKLPVNGDVHSIKRNSKAIIKKWKNNFTEKEIKKIRDRLEPISCEFYSDNDW